MIDVVVVNWNAGPQLMTCIDSIDSFIVSKVIVVDNGSTDKSAELVMSLPKVKLIDTKENLGFGRACNLGAQKANAEYLLFLNPDAAVYPETIDKALMFMQKPSNADVGICGVQLVNEDGHVARSCSRFPSPIGFLAHAIGVDRFFPRMGYFMAEWPHDKTQDVDHVIGAFFLVRRNLFETLGGFDERFFLYLEDLDFSNRASQIGWRSVYLADAKAFHAGGGTSNQVKARRLFYSLRSRLLYAHKHFGLIGFVVVFLATFFIEPISRILLAISRHSWDSLKETWIGYLMLLGWLPQWVLKGVTR